MSELSIAFPSSGPLVLHKHMRMTPKGKIKIAAKSKSKTAIRITILILLGLTIYALLTFDYKNIDMGDAVAGTWRNAKTLFGEPRLNHSALPNALHGLLVTFSLGALATIFGAILGLLGALFCAKNIANPVAANIIKSFVAFIRAVPTILWVLIFTVAASLGSVAAVVGLTFHSAGYLVKAYAESIEEVDSGAIEALKAGGASFWQIVFRSILPSAISRMTAWTFLRFEINFVNALAVGAAAGAAGLGFDLYLAGYHYFDLRELGFITYIVVATVILLELLATKVKAKVR